MINNGDHVDLAKLRSTTLIDLRQSFAQGDWTFALRNVSFPIVIAAKNALDAELTIHV